MYLHDTKPFSYTVLRNDYFLLRELQETITKAVATHTPGGIIWLRVKLVDSEVFMLEFTIPEFKDGLELKFLQAMNDNKTIP